MGCHLGNLLDQLWHIPGEPGVLRLCRRDHHHAVARRQEGLDDSFRRIFGQLQGSRAGVQIVEAERHEADRGSPFGRAAPAGVAGTTAVPPPPLPCGVRRRTERAVIVCFFPVS